MRVMELLERDFHLAELAQALAMAEREAGQLVLVSGEAGIGKTSLVEQFARQHRTGRRFLWGACDDLFTPRPLGPLHDIARQTGGPLAAQLQTPTDPAAVAAAFLAPLVFSSDCALCAPRLMNVYRYGRVALGTSVSAGIAE